MNNFKQVIINKITRNAIIYTLLLLIVYRLGTYIPTPGINGSVVNALASSTGADLASFFDFFGGGSIQQMAIFALGVSPYITSSIVIQLLESDLSPAMSEWKHQGVDGQNKRSKWTKRLTLTIALIQSLGISYGYHLMGQTVIEDNNYLIVGLIMTAGTAILVWIADRITEKGIGNGVSFLIVAGILSQIPLQLNLIIESFSNKTGEALFQQYLLWIIISIIILIVIIMVIYYNLAYRKVAINYVRSSKGTIRQNSYLPIKLNPAGVIPIIFAAPFLLLVKIGLDFATARIPLFAENGVGMVENIVKSFFGGGDYWILYVLLYGLIVLIFSIVYSQIQLNPEQMTENLEKQSAYIVGVRPGEDTLKYLTNAIKLTSFWGGLVLMILAVLPTIIQHISGINFELSLLGTGLIIIVSVLVQIYQSLVNKVESKKYRRLLGVK